MNKNEAKAIYEIGQKMRQAIIMLDNYADEKRDAAGSENVPIEYGKLRQKLAEVQEELSATRRDLGRLLDEIRTSSGAIANHTYCAYFQQTLIEHLWEAHNFSYEEGGDKNKIHKGGVVFDIALTFDSFTEKGEEYADVNQNFPWLHAGVTWEGTVYMEADEARDFKQAMNSGLQINMWTSKRE